MSQNPPEGEQAQERLKKREQGIQKYKEMLAECIANGDKLVPLWRNSLITSGTFTIATIRRWVYEGRFPFIKIGRRRYTSNKVLAQWILDGQKDKEVFCLGYTKTLSRISYQWKGIYKKAREVTNERRIAAGLPPLPEWQNDPPRDSVPPPEPVIENPPEPEPIVRKEVIVEDLMPSDEDLYSDPG